MDEFLLENNKGQIESIAEFLHGSKPLLLVNGFMGTGKKFVVNHSLSDFEGIVLEYNCFETTVLDDILLSFFDNFKKLEALGIIEQPKMKTDNFTQKIDAYLKSATMPVVLVIDSFEEVLKDNKREILDFIFQLPLGVKVIMIARVFKYVEFEGQEFETVAILALAKDVFAKYLRAAGIKASEILCDELYKYTRGYYLYTTFAIRVMQLKNLSLTDFMANYNKSLLTFNDFILREMLSFVDPVNGHLFRFLTVIRHPVPVKLLQTLGLYNEARVNYFLQNKLLVSINNQIFLEDYFKSVNENSISEGVAVKIHKGCLELYETQLPLKPLERDLLISRRTMRRESEYHSHFVPKKVVAVTAEEVVCEEPVIEETKVEDLSFIFETEESSEAFNTIADTIQDFIKVSDEEEEIKKMSVTELMNCAKGTKFDFKKALKLYQRALTLENDDDYYTFLPVILTKLALTCRELSDWHGSLQYYGMALEFYGAAGDDVKVNEIKRETARIYYETFKPEKAKALLEEIIHSAPDDLQSYLLLVDLSDNPEPILKRALQINSTDKNLLGELYFKQALFLDEHDDPEDAVRFYKKCIETGGGKYLAAAYTNIASIFEDVGETKHAIKALLESLRADEANNNKDGVYISAMKLGALYTDRQKAQEYYKKALACAEELREPLYINAATTALDNLYV
jgi:tetratricopeptide (TPR) repeat protein